MSFYHKTLIAEQWLLQFENFVKRKAREEAELLEYEKKPDHNPKAVALRREKLESDLQFLTITKQLIDAQSDELQEMQRKTGLGNHYKEKYELLEMYSRSKGIDTELANYMKKSDFRHY